MMSTMFSLKMLVVACFASLLASCAIVKSTDTLKAASDNFDKAVQAAKTALETEQKAKPRTRRFEAVEYYIQTRLLVGTDVAVLRDLTASDPVASFTRYACAGTGSLIRERNAIQYAGAYSAGLKDILAPGAATIAAQYARFNALGAPITIPPPPGPPKPNQVQSCATELSTMLSSWKPAPTTDAYDENPIAVLAAAITAYQALDKFMTTALTEWNNYEAKVKFANYVNKWDADFKRVLTEDLSEDKLKEAYRHRVAVSVQRPLALFKTIFDRPADALPQQDDERIRQIGFQVNDQLAEFDALHGAPAPAEIQRALLDAEAKMVVLANDEKVSIDQAVSFLAGLADVFNTAQKQYEEADKAARALGTAVRE